MLTSRIDVDVPPTTPRKALSIMYYFRLTVQRQVTPPPGPQNYTRIRPQHPRQPWQKNHISLIFFLFSILCFFPSVSSCFLSFSIFLPLILLYLPSSSKFLRGEILRAPTSQRERNRERATRGCLCSRPG